MGWDDSDDDWDSEDKNFQDVNREHTGFTDEEEEEEEPPKQAAEVAAAKAPVSNKPKKKTMKQIIAEREAKEREKEAERAAFQREVQEAEAEMTADEKKARRKAQQMQADLENAEDLFAATEISEEEKPDYAAHPKTVAEFTQYAKLLATHFKTLQGEKPYQTFVEEFVRLLTVDMDIDDCKALSTVCTVALNGKQQAQRAKDTSKSKKKNKKPSLKSSMGATDDGSRYDDMYSDFL